MTVAAAISAGQAYTMANCEQTVQEEIQEETEEVVACVSQSEYVELVRLSGNVVRWCSFLSDFYIPG